MKTILVPTDFSRNSDNAIHFALELNRKLKAKMVLFHSYVVADFAGDLPLSMPSDDELRKSAEKGMHLQEKKIKEEYPGMEMETMTSAGYPENEIIQISSDRKTDLVIMGTQGASGLREVLVGSITAAVMEDTTCPVLAIPEKAEFSELRKIVFATNFADKDFENVAYVIDLARKFDA